MLGDERLGLVQAGAAHRDSMEFVEGIAAKLAVFRENEVEKARDSPPKPVGHILAPDYCLRVKREVAPPKPLIYRR